MDRWFDAFEQWPSDEQMVFSIVCIFFAAAFVGLLGCWTLRAMCWLTTWRHGWPKIEVDPFEASSRYMEELRHSLYTELPKQVKNHNAHDDIPMPNLLGLKLHRPDDSHPPA